MNSQRMKTCLFYCLCGLGPMMTALLRGSQFPQKTCFSTADTWSLERKKISWWLAKWVLTSQWVMLCENKHCEPSSRLECSLHNESGSNTCCRKGRKLSPSKPCPIPGTGYYKHQNPCHKHEAFGDSCPQDT